MASRGLDGFDGWGRRHRCRVGRPEGSRRRQGEQPSSRHQTQSHAPERSREHSKGHTYRLWGV
jgi:hypothetical protein